MFTKICYIVCSFFYVFMRKLRTGLIPVMFLTPVERVDGCHLFIRQLEVEYGNVLLDVVGIARTGNDHDAFLQIPAQDDLCR